MASPYDRYGDPDDYFANTRMSFGDHLDELRRHLLRAIGWLAIGMVIAFCFGGSLLALITGPIKKELGIYRKARVEQRRIGRHEHQDSFRDTPHSQIRAA